MATGKRSSEKALQKVLGKGANVNADNPLEVHDPKVGSLISYEGTTTADGAGDGSSLIDSVLASKPDYNGNLVIITSGAYAGQGSDIDAATTGGTVSAHTAFGGQILRGTTFVIVALRLTPAEVAALTTMVQTGQYYDRVFFDSVNGIAGIAWPVGTPQVPSDVIADVITILAARNLRKIEVHGALLLGATMNHRDFYGNYHESAGDIVNLGGQDVSDSHFRGLIITGVQGGAGLATYKECLFLTTGPIPMTGFRGLAENCAIFSGLTLATGNADYADFDHCTSVHGHATVVIGSPDRVSFKEFSGGLILTAQTGGEAFVRGISGYLEIDEMTGGTLDIYAHGADITINADCTGGTINIWGSAVVTNNAVGAIVNDYTIDQRAANIDTQLDGLLVQVPFFAQVETIQNGVVTIFEFDALGCTIREIHISLYLPLHATATLTPLWEKTRAGDLVTFVGETIPAIAGVAPVAATNVRYHFGEIAQGLQGRLRLTQSDHAGVITVDAYAVVLMEI